MYYIYHIPGVKIGCTVNPKRRIFRQRYTEYEILEVHDCIRTAERRELELQKQYGYKVDTIPYSQTTEMASRGGKAQRSQAKFTMEQANHIRQRFKHGDTISGMAEEYNVNYKTIRKIVRNRSYATP